MHGGVRKILTQHEGRDIGLEKNVAPFDREIIRMVYWSSRAGGMAVWLIDGMRKEGTMILRVLGFSLRCNNTQQPKFLAIKTAAHHVRDEVDVAGGLSA